MEKAKQRIEKLRKIIKYHRYLYHVLDRQEISDSASDSLKKELFDLEQIFPELITEDSPTQRVSGQPLDKFKKVKHSLSMLSLNDAFSEEDILLWYQRIEKLTSKKIDFFCEAKMDGLAVSLIYKKGIFKRGSTRGDGKTGEDVTFNLKTIDSIPLSLEKKIDCEVRGEVFITKKQFQKLNKDKKYANPRNLAAGSIRQLDSKVARERKLSFVAWQVLGEKSQKEEYEKLKEIGFKPSKGQYCQDLDEVFQYYKKLQKKREKMSYEIDGVVVSVNNNELFSQLGVVGKAPRGAIAFKFPGQESTTKVENIRVQVGRTGNVTPVAELKPVRVGGVIIARATLHNKDELKRLGVKIGDTVIVERAGDVIPRVVKVLKELRDKTEKEFKMPSICPICKTRLEKQETILRCPNKSCKTRVRKQFHHFVSKGCFDIEGVGPKIIDQLLKQGLIQNQTDLFSLRKEDLIPLERFGEKSAENTIASIVKAKNIEFSRFIFALGIGGVGEETARDLSFYFKNINDLIKAKKQDLLNLKDIGEGTAESIYSFFKENPKLVNSLLEKGVKIKKEKRGDKFQGKVFVLTGTLLSFSRQEIKERIINQGGEVSSSVSKNTDFVVSGENPGSKIEKAKKLKVKVISEQEFLSL